VYECLKHTNVADNQLKYSDKLTEFISCWQYSNVSFDHIQQVYLIGLINQLSELIITENFETPVLTLRSFIEISK